MNKDMYLIRAVEMATIAAYKFIGRKNKNAIDFAAVEAMTIMLDNAPIKCRIIVGEGELDQAPMLFVNQELGKGKTLTYDLAVDPVEGTYPAAYNIAGSIACLAAAAPNTILKLPEMYMEKLFVGTDLQDAINNEDDFITNIKTMQKMKKHNDLIGIILDKPRHQKIIEKLDDLGIIVRLIGDGDVLAAIDVINKEADFVYGIGGAPEGALMAALALSAGGNIKTKLISYQTIWPTDEDTKIRINIEDIAIKKYKLSYNKYYFAKDLVKDENVRFVATGLTAGGSLKAIKYYYGTYYLNTFFVSHGVVRNMEVTYSVSQVNKLLPSVEKIMKIYNKYV
ncbi:fructose-bisphosphatase class II [Spiroplasma endosymbiont of Dactylopius coccus]|nr:fructose-bisphosphatase class II [Spiroplasma ixodetis]